MGDCVGQVDWSMEFQLGRLMGLSGFCGAGITLLCIFVIRNYSSVPVSSIGVQAAAIVTEKTVEEFQDLN